MNAPKQKVQNQGLSVGLKRLHGRLFYEVDLEIPSQSAGNPPREYYAEELVAI